LSLYLNYTTKDAVNGKIVISGSKSESNRLLILQQLFPELQIENLSNSDDTKYLKRALENKTDTIDIGHAGTAMRFLTAYLAVQENKTVTLTGSTRMQERPIKILVDALLDLGADITYLKKEGYPPLLIKGKKLSENKLSIKGNVSSQYISALLLIAPTLPNGLEIHLDGIITSIPYIEMTLSLLKKIGVKITFKNTKIAVKPIQNSTFITQNLKIEPDWSSASYFYSIAALQPNTHIELVGLLKNSLQGDSVLPEIYKQFGVQTTYTQKGIILTSEKSTLYAKLLTFNLSNTPDLAQTIAVTCLGLGINCHLTGLHTLKIKETDRLQALKNELEKIGAKVTITDKSLQLKSPSVLHKNKTIQTYEDHRMAMAFAPLSLKIPIYIDKHEVVSKSYLKFWDDLSKLLA